MPEYIPRLTAPDSGDKHYYSDNVFYQSNYGLPNCTCYAWGRWYELTGEKPNLCTANAENWFNYSDGYSRGTVPMLGAIAVWAKGQIGVDTDGAGHVAVVEQINSDGTFVTSNSYYGGSLFALETIPADCSRSGNTFQGFIYLPTTYNDSEWIAKNEPLTTAEQENNATIVYRRLRNAGWSRNAIAAILANMQAESRINPGAWEGYTNNPEAFKNAYGYYPGFGLVQWTPYTKYTSWAGADWNSNYNLQIERILWEMENGEQWISTTNYPESFKEFSKSDRGAYYLACAFMYNYERPAAEYADPVSRGSAGLEWYNWLAKFYPSGQPLKLPIWLVFAMSEANGG